MMGCVVGGEVSGCVFSGILASQRELSSGITWNTVAFGWNGVWVGMLYFLANSERSQEVRT